MKHKNNIPDLNDPDPQPPELREAHYPTLKKVWRGWAIGIAIVLVVILTLSIIFRATGY